MKYTITESKYRRWREPFDRMNGVNTGLNRSQLRRYKPIAESDKPQQRTERHWTAGLLPTPVGGRTEYERKSNGRFQTGASGSGHAVAPDLMSIVHTVFHVFVVPIS